MDNLNVSRKAQFNFTGLFAIIAGAAILMLAIYGVSKAVNNERYKIDTEIAKKIFILTNPLQAGFSEGKSGEIIFKQESRINNFCFDSPDFGRNDISVSTRSEIGKPWDSPGEEVSVKNKYIFSSEKNTGEKYYIFSKPFRFPYKVSDLVFVTSKRYCFIGASESIIDEVEGIKYIEIDN